MATTTLDPKVSQDIVSALSIAELPDVRWQSGDDLCDCTYQRIGHWTNPYLAETLEVRMCCIWAELYKQFPQFVRNVPAYWNENAQRWETEPATWNADIDMPAAMWHRQLARKYGVSVAAARLLSEAETPPTAHEKLPFIVPLADGRYAVLDLNSRRVR